MGAPHDTDDGHDPGVPLDVEGSARFLRDRYRDEEALVRWDAPGPPGTPDPRRLTSLGIGQDLVDLALAWAREPATTVVPGVERSRALLAVLLRPYPDAPGGREDRPGTR